VEQSRSNEPVGPDQMLQRNLLVNSFFAKSKISPATASLDPQQVAMVAALAAGGAHEVDPKLSELADQLKSIAGELKDYKNVSLKSSNNCHHFANALLTDEGMTLPLGKPSLSYKGLVTFEKNAAEMWLAMGTTTSNFNVKANAIEVSFSAASLGFIGEIDDVGRLGGFYQGPPHTATDNRIQSQQPSVEANALFKQYRAIPADYGQFWQNGACPPEKDAQIDAMLVATNFSALFLGDLSEGEALAALTVASKALDCGHDFMQSSIPNSHGYGLFEAFVWMHMLFEAPQSNLGDIATWNGWNDVDVLEQY